MSILRCIIYAIAMDLMQDTWRTVTIDDRIPVDLFGRPLLVGVRPLQLWPLLLSKAILKVMASVRILEKQLPNQVAAFQLLTGWPQEDLLDMLSGTPVKGGFLFDRLEDSLHEAENQPERHSIGTACLVNRALPEKPPPRIIVFTGPGAVGRGRLMQRLVEEYPDKFGLTISHTTRRPREHEVQGQTYNFTDKASFLADMAEGKFLEHAAVTGKDLDQHGTSTFLYGTSIATVREVAATGKLCVMGLDEQGVKALQANRRIDGLYLFISPPSMAELEARARGRLKEAPSTIIKRLEWAEKQMELAAKPGLFNHVIDNSQFDAVRGLGLASAGDAFMCPCSIL